MDVIWRSQIVLTQLVEAMEIQWVTIVLTWLVEAMEIQWVTIVLTWLVEAMEIQWVTDCTDLAGGSDLVEAMEFYLVTKFTDTGWWKPWNFNGSQNSLIPVGGSNGGKNRFWLLDWCLVETVEWLRSGVPWKGFRPHVREWTIRNDFGMSKFPFLNNKRLGKLPCECQRGGQLGQSPTFAPLIYQYPVCACTQFPDGNKHTGHITSGQLSDRMVIKYRALRGNLWVPKDRLRRHNPWPRSSSLAPSQRSSPPSAIWLVIWYLHHIYAWVNVGYSTTETN
ncbi:hypothetical protein B0H13DRAFT_1902896 [Mycena leptocephala]|nr:hypothetical protein B0H13DRAFT_1902896 [Mycena leptocephala]